MSYEDWYNSSYGELVVSPNFQLTPLSLIVIVFTPPSSGVFYLCCINIVTQLQNSDIISPKQRGYIMLKRLSDRNTATYTFLQKSQEKTGVWTRIKFADLHLAQKIDVLHFAHEAVRQLNMFDWNRYNLDRRINLKSLTRSLSQPAFPRPPLPYKSWHELLAFEHGYLNMLAYESEKIEYFCRTEQAMKIYTPDAMFGDFALELKGFFKDHHELNKVIDIHLSSNKELFVILQHRNIRVYPFDSNQKTIEEMLDKNGIQWGYYDDLKEIMIYINNQLRSRNK